jgi:hypothetical protein
MPSRKQFAEMISAIAGQSGKMEPRLEQAAAAIARREGAAAVTPQKIIAEYNRMSGAPGGQSFGPPQPRTAAEMRGAPETPTGRDPVAFERRLQSDRPRMEQAVTEEAPVLGGRVEGMEMPDLLDAYASPEDAIRRLRIGQPVGGPSGPGVRVGGPSGPGRPVGTPYSGGSANASREMIVRPPRDVVPTEPRGLITNEQAVQENIARQFDNITGGARRRPADPDYSLPLGIGAAAATAGVLSRMYPRDPGPAEAPVEATPQMQDDTPALDNTDGAADLAAEATPPPAMPAEAPPFAAADLSEEQFTERFKRQYLEREARRAQPAAPPQPVDYSLQAREMIDDLNARRRAAGGEVPEAQAMMQEIRRLQELGNQTRRATYVAAPGDDASRYYQQAQGLIDQLNAEYRTGALTPNSPRARQVMAQVRQLQQAGDNLRNRRAG